MSDLIVTDLPIKDYLVNRIAEQLPAYTVKVLRGDSLSPSECERASVYLGHPREEDLHMMPNLKFIQAGYAGVDALPMNRLKQTDIIVCSAKGIHNAQMSELFFAMLLHCERNMSAWASQKERREWNKQAVKETVLIAGKKLCIVGYGTIGKKVAMIAQTFDMHVIGVRSNVSKDERYGDPFTDEVMPVEEIGEGLADSDYVLNLLPLTSSTENFFDDRVFSMVKRGSVFVNLGRGATVVDEALLRALDEHIVRYAALDVFREEPLPAQHPFWTHPRIFMTPHIGGLMPKYWDAVVDIFIENVKRLERGDELLNIVDKQKGY